MKKILLIIASTIFMICSTVAFAATNDVKSVDLREYQQTPGTINVLAAPFEGTDSYLATFNFEHIQKGDSVDFYQGICVVDQRDRETLHPLTVKKIKGNEEQFSEAILDKKGNMPYKQDFRRIQTSSKEAVSYQGGDSTDIVLLGKFKVTTSAGTFDDCIGIKIYNRTNGEGMIQYLAKGIGVVYMEGIKADGSKVEIARLEQMRDFDDADISWFKQSYFV